MAVPRRTGRRRGGQGGAAALNAGARRAVVLDGSAVAFCDSSAINVIVTEHKRRVDARRGQRLVIAGPSLELAAVLEVMVLQHVLLLAGTVDEVLAGERRRAA